MITLLHHGLREDVEASDYFIADRIIKPYIELTMMYDQHDREEAFRLHAAKLLAIYKDRIAMLNAYGALRRQYGIYISQLRNLYFQAGYDNIEVDLI